MKTDFAEIKRTTDIVSVVQSRGVELKREGKDWRGLCPFHADAGHPNLIVTQDKGLFHCPACGAAGNVIQFVARIDQLTEREAALKLLAAVPGVSVASAMLPAAKPPLVVPPEVAAALLLRVSVFYAKTLHKVGAGLDYLKTRELADPALLETFAVGYCDGSLRQTLPQSGELVEQLKALGVLNEKGNEVLYKRVVVPIYNATGDVVSLYGRRTSDEEPRHLHMRGERQGVFNGQAAKAYKSLIVVESIFDAMSLWQAGFRNAIALYGKDGWTKDHTALIRENAAVKEIYTALDNDAAGQAGTKKLLPILKELGITAHCVTWPDGVSDANAFFSSRVRAGLANGAEDFDCLLKAPNPQAFPSKEPKSPPENEGMEISSDGFAVVYSSDAGSRRYELCGVERHSASRLKATVRAIVPGAQRFVIDTLDFYMLRSKRSFIAEAARLFKESVEIIEADVNRLTLAAESFVSQRSAGALPTADAVGSDAERAEGLRLGRSPDLLGEIRRDLEKLGVIGEHSNGLLLYLAITSRKIDDPLAVQILSSSGAGKSHLLDAVLTLCPEEDLVKVTSLSDCALFYKGEDSLRRKVLAVSEVAGAEGARYALRNLISEKKLVKESTVTNPVTGRLGTQVSTVYGPTSVLETTTKPNTDPETKSRYWVIAVDESLEQTLAILEAQRHAQTLEGRKKQKARAAILARHHSFQRSLKPMLVINPFATVFEYRDPDGHKGTLTQRRDHPKYLNLILVVTFLHQHQRAVRHDAELGDYIESTLEDVAIANALVSELMGQTLDELSLPSRELLRLIGEYVTERATATGKKPETVEWTRRELREAIQWTEARLRLHLAELVKLECLATGGGRWGKAFSYRLAITLEEIEAGNRKMPGIQDVETLRKEANFASAGGNFASENTNFASTSQVPICEVQSTAKPDESRGSGGDAPNFAGSGGKHIYVLHKKNGAAPLEPAGSN